MARAARSMQVDMVEGQGLTLLPPSNKRQRRWINSLLEWLAEAGIFTSAVMVSEALPWEATSPLWTTYLRGLFAERRSLVWPSMALRHSTTWPRWTVMDGYSRRNWSGSVSISPPTLPHLLHRLSASDNSGNDHGTLRRTAFWCMKSSLGTMNLSLCVGGPTLAAGTHRHMFIIQCPSD